MVSIMVLATAGSAQATAPILEFVPTTTPFPVAFVAEGGEVSAALSEFDTEVHCTGSHGEGAITGPRSTSSSYAFTGCVTVGGSKGGAKCKSEGAAEEEIVSPTLEADLVYIDQARQEVGMVLNPHGGTYLSFKCAGEPVKALGSFLSPVGPINTEASSFTAILRRSGSLQIPNEYENASGERIQAIPTGEREGQPAATTGVELSFTIQTSAPLEIKAVPATEEAPKPSPEAGTATPPKPPTRAQLLAKALRRCRKFHSPHRRAHCRRHARKKYRAPSSPLGAARAAA